MTRLSIDEAGGFWYLYSHSYQRYWQACFKEQGEAIECRQRIYDDWRSRDHLSMITDLYTNFVQNVNDVRRPKKVKA